MQTSTAAQWNWENIIDNVIPYSLSILGLKLIHVSSTVPCKITWYLTFETYRQTSNIRRALLGNKIVDHLDAVGASPPGGAPTTFPFSNYHLAPPDWAKTTARRDEKHLSLWFGASYITELTVNTVCLFVFTINDKAYRKGGKIVWK